MKRFGTVLLVAALTGCTSVPLETPKPDESRLLLEQALNRVERLPAGTASADAKAAPAVTKGQSISLNYAGEGKSLLKQIAAARGLGFHVRGSQPHLPLFVIVDLKDVSLEEFLTDVGAQFGQRADLVLTNSAIEVRYRGQ
jgi:hypothetical protein